MTDDSAFKKRVRARMAETGENYTTARWMVIAGRDPGQPPAALWVYLNPHVDLELTDETAGDIRPLMSRASESWRTGRWPTTSSWPGSRRPGVAAGSELETVQDLWIEEIADAIHRRIPRAAGDSQYGAQRGPGPRQG